MPGEEKEPTYPKLTPPELKLPKAKEGENLFALMDKQQKDDLLQALDWLEKEINNLRFRTFPVKDEIETINLWYERARDIILKNEENIPMGIRRPIKDYLTEIYRKYLKKWKEAEGKTRKKQGY